MKSNDYPETDEWLTLSEAAKKLSVHPTTLRRWADKGDMPCMLTPGGHRRFSVADVDHFARTQRGLRRVRGIEQTWAQQTLDQTRKEIVVQQDQPWLTTLDDDARAQYRQLGQQLLGLTLQYLSDENGGHILEQARQIGRQYARLAQHLGLPLPNALEASMFFRDMLMETALQLPDTTRIRPDANVRLLRRVNTLLNNVQLAIAEVYAAD